MVDADEAAPSKGRLAGLWLLAVGVVYGDIGTSPLYALREAFAHGVDPTPANVLGILSLVAWSLMLIISVKYLVIVLRADNRGEGGVLALTALVHRGASGRLGTIALGIGLLGAALLYGDSMITPAISVLSAVEGITVAAPALDDAVIPLTLAILAGLFWAQRHGTAGVGRIFGPVTLLWFVTLFGLGVSHIAQNPVVLHALDPRHAVSFIVSHGWGSLAVLGAVFLVVTGGEALYADLGHFGTRPIRLAWFTVALPALMTNYLGQGALVLSDPSTAANPFYSLAPSWALVPLIVLATMATIVASQAVITGAFSLTFQAIHLGWLPRLRVRHTSVSEAGQIYIPLVNWLLFAACVYLVTTFRSSSALAGAYGLAVAGTMVLTTLLLAMVAMRHWGWGKLTTAAALGGFLVIELAFLAANGLKFIDGGWFPLLVAVAIVLLLVTWRTGRKILNRSLAHEHMPMREFLRQEELQPATRVPGVAVYMAADPTGPPPALVRNLQHHKVRHDKIVLVTVIPEEVSHVFNRNRVEVHELGYDMWHVVARYGFVEEPHVPRVLLIAQQYGLSVDTDDATYFVGMERVISTPRYSGMAYWRERLFAFMVRNAQRPSAYFQLPRERVIEVGVQIEI